jgi:hypothetical protein
MDDRITDRPSLPSDGIADQPPGTALWDSVPPWERLGGFRRDRDLRLVKPPSGPLLGEWLAWTVLIGGTAGPVIVGYLIPERDPWDWYVTGLIVGLACGFVGWASSRILRLTLPW